MVKRFASVLVAILMFAVPCYGADTPTSPSPAVVASTAPTTPTKKADRYAGFRPAKGEYRYVGAWRGRKKGGKRIGLGTCVLISPNWIATAGHVASPKASDPENRIIKVTFPGGVSRVVVEARKPKGGDFAIARLTRPVTEIEPIQILKRTLDNDREQFAFTITGQTSGLHAIPGHKGFGDGRVAWRPKGQGLPGGIGGDSGAPWVFDKPGDKDDVLFATIMGGGKRDGQQMGRAFQVAVHREWIDEALATTGDKARWVALPDWVELKPRDVALPANWQPAVR